MSYSPRPAAKPPSVQAVLAQQKADSDRQRKAAPTAKPATAPAPAALATPAAVVPLKPALPAVPDNRTAYEQYLDEIAPATTVGRLVKFNGKDAKFVYADDDTEIADTVDFVVLDDQVMASWIKFHGKGEPPDRIGGLLSDGFVLPPRETLGDADKSLWEMGLNGEPADPWVHQLAVVMKRVDNDEMVTFVTGNATGRRAVGNLLKHANRLHRTSPDHYTVTRLTLGGYNHRDERVGWVVVPVFKIVGKQPTDSVAKPDTSLAGDMNDEIPPF